MRHLNSGEFSYNNQMSQSTRDERLAQVLEDVAERQRRGQPPDMDELSRQHPDLVEELRQLLAVAEVAREFAVNPTPPTINDPNRLPPPNLAVQVTAQTGPRLFGDFELVEEIGRGGMGVVYKAWEKSLKRFVALKMILAGEHASGADLARFRTEAQSAAGLSHPNIVPVYQVDSLDGQAYFSMKYVEGPTLAERVKSGPLPPRDAARYLAVVARAVHHAHQKGILHRDLKPANILLDFRFSIGDFRLEDRGARDDNSSEIKNQESKIENAIPMVSDFGLAKRVEGSIELTGTGAIVGTPSYMSPEQASGQPGSVGPASDIYSLGAVLYEMLTGRPPFLAASPIDTLLLVRAEEPVRPRLLNPRIDLDLEFICRKCLEKKPEHRYASAAHLADDLDAYLKGEPVSARSSSLVYFINRIFRESHQAQVMENWGGLWMWHSLKIFLLCAVTSAMYALGVDSHVPYLALWGVGLVTWGLFFWYWRRRAGPVAFVERQLAHAWAGGVVASIGCFIVEVVLGRPVLELTPVLAVMAGMVFLVMAGMLSGWFYLAAGACFLSALPMAMLDPQWSTLLFGAVSAFAFFVPGLKYYRQRRRCIEAKENPK